MIIPLGIRGSRIPWRSECAANQFILDLRLPPLGWVNKSGIATHTPTQVEIIHFQFYNIQKIQVTNFKKFNTLISVYNIQKSKLQISKKFNTPFSVLYYSKIPSYQFQNKKRFLFLYFMFTVSFFLWGRGGGPMGCRRGCLRDGVQVPICIVLGSPELALASVGR